LLAGIITVPAAYIGVAIADQRRTYQEKLLRNSLQFQIQELEAEEAQLYQSLSAATATRHEVEASINALQSERSYLLNRVSELHTQRNELYQELTFVQKQKQQQEAEFYSLQTQIQQFEQQQTELSQSLANKLAQIQQAELRFNRLQVELDQLQNQIAQKQNQQEQINKTLMALEQRKQELGGETYDLETNIKVLEQRQEQLNQTLLPLQVRKQQVQTTLTSEQERLKQLKTQISTHQKQQEQLNQDLASLERQKRQLEAEYQRLQSQIEALESQTLSLTSTQLPAFQNEMRMGFPEEWLEWLEFTQQLPNEQRKAFKAILERDETALNTIADDQVTRPQVLIDSINYRAIDKMGDALLVNGEISTIPEINQVYAPILTEPATIYFKDLLDYLRTKKTHQVLEGLALPLTQAASVEPSKIWRCDRTLNCPANSLIICSDGRTLISGGTDGKIKLWDLKTGELLTTLAGHASSVDCVVIASDNKILVSGGSDSTIKLWNLETRELLHTFSGHSKSIKSLALSPDGNLLASSSYDNSIKVWDIRANQLIRTLQDVSSLASSLIFNFSSDRKILTAGLVEGRILQWDLDTVHWPSTMLWNTHKFESLVISSDSKTLILGDALGSLRIVKLDMGVDIASCPREQGSVLSLALSPDGTTFLSAGNDIRLWDLASRKLLARFVEHSDKVCTVVFSPKGDTFASSSQDGSIKIWQ
ncbi:MAG TPA: hypothetical protein V6C95_05840, partial [Coleofasciculaceae cyanobacterium]